MADSFQSSSSVNQSSSVPTLFPTPQSDWTLQLAQLLGQLGNNQMAWAMQEYARAGAVTDAQINNYLQLAQQGTNLAGQTIDRYMNQFAPLENQYAREAQSYASAPRIQSEMGAAESRAMQAQNQAKINAENELESFGIDPSSGRYQDLVRASNTQAAAAAAAAGESARIATEQEGQRRKVNAIMMGQQLPGAAVNALNSGYQGVSGAVNAALGLANTGSNLTTSAAQFFNPAMRPLQPMMGNVGQSSGSSGSQGGSSGGGGGGGSRSSDPFNMDRFGRGSSAPPMPLNSSGSYAPQNRPGYTAQPATYRAPGSGITNVQGGGYSPSYDMGGWDQYDPYASLDPWSQASGSVYDQNGWWNSGYDPTGGFGGSVQDMWGNNPYWTGSFGDTSGGSYDWGYDPGVGYQGWDSGGWGSGGSSLGGWDTSALGGWDGFGSSGSYDPWGSAPASDPWSGGGSSYDWGSSYSDPYSGGYSGGSSSWDSGGWDTGGSSVGGWDTSALNSDWGGGGGWDSGYSDWGGGGGSFDYFSKGGPAPLPRGNMGGGKVPSSMSPSGGQRVDDVPATIPQTGGRAMLNAGEFVLPRDVVAWKGQEFFQKMIEQARKARMGAPAKPSSKPPGGFNDA